MDKVGDLSRKVEDLKSKADRLDGKADVIATQLASGGGGPRRGRAAARSPSCRSPAWSGGGPANEALDAAPDPSKPPGTPGRYRNFVTLDPTELIPPESRAKPDGRLGTSYGPQEKSFNPIISTSASMQEEIEQYVGDAPAGEHWADPYRYSPALCWRIEVSPDYSEYTLFFRRDAFWQPLALDLSKYPHLRGQHQVTARDFKFTVDTIMNPQVECASLRAYFKECEGVTVVDDFTAVVRWKPSYYHSIGFTLGRQLLPEYLYAKDADGTRFPRRRSASSSTGTSTTASGHRAAGRTGCSSTTAASGSRSSASTTGTARATASGTPSRRRSCSSTRSPRPRS